MLKYLDLILSEIKPKLIFKDAKVINIPSIAYSKDGDFKEIYSTLSISDSISFVKPKEMKNVIIQQLNEYTLHIISSHLSQLLFDKDSEIFNSIQLTTDTIHKFAAIHNSIALSNYKPYIKDFKNYYVHPYAAAYWREYSGVFLINSNTKFVFPQIMQEESLLNIHDETSLIYHVNNIPFKVTYIGRDNNERKFLISTYVRTEIDQASTAHIRLPYKEFSNE